MFQKIALILQKKRLLNIKNSRRFNRLRRLIPKTNLQNQLNQREKDLKTSVESVGKLQIISATISPIFGASATPIPESRTAQICLSEIFLIMGDFSFPIAIIPLQR